MALINLTFIKPEIDDENHILYRRLDTKEIIPKKSINVLWGRPIMVIPNEKSTIQMNHLDSEQKANNYLLKQKPISNSIDVCDSKNEIYFGHYSKIK